MTATFGVGASGIDVDYGKMLVSSAWFVKNHRHSHKGCIYAFLHLIIYRFCLRNYPIYCTSLHYTQQGLIPSIPHDSATLVLSTVGTTAIPFNLFLAGSIAEGNTVESMRFGIRIATGVMFTSSFLITVVGSGVHHNPSDMEHEFKVADLVNVLRTSAGERAVVCFAAGLFCAAFSAAIGATMAAALTAQSLLEKSDFEVAPGEREGSNRQIKEAKREKRWGEKGFRFRGTLLWVILVGALTSGFDLPTVPVVLMCQVVNGILLPFLSTCLILCVNDPKIMAQEPQTPFQNITLALAVTFTVFLACVGLIDNIFNISVAEIDKDEDLIFSIAGVVTACYFAWLSMKMYVQIVKRDDGYFRVSGIMGEDDSSYQGEGGKGKGKKDRRPSVTTATSTDAGE